jgi:hypothetical protein
MTQSFLRLYDGTHAGGTSIVSVGWLHSVAASSETNRRSRRPVLGFRQADGHSDRDDLRARCAGLMRAVSLPVNGWVIAAAVAGKASGVVRRRSGPGAMPSCARP